LQKFGLFSFQYSFFFFIIMSCLFSNLTLQKTPDYPLVHPRPTLTPSPPHADNRIGAAGAAAVAGALEPRRNGDGSWTPSTALTVLDLECEWLLILMVVTEEELGCSCASIADRPIPFRIHKRRPSIRPNLLQVIFINTSGSILSTHPIYVLS
jgi:hypothetical protein